MAFGIECTEEAGRAVLAVRGDVDIATAPDLRTALARAVERFPMVVVDLADVGFMDSTGLGILVAAYNRAAGRGNQLVVARPQRIVRNALRLVQVDHVIDVYDTLDEALAAS